MFLSVSLFSVVAFCANVGLKKKRNIIKILRLIFMPWGDNNRFVARLIKFMDVLCG